MFHWQPPWGGGAEKRWFRGFSGDFIHSFFSCCFSCDSLMLGFSCFRSGRFTSSKARKAAFIRRSGWGSSSPGPVLGEEGEAACQDCGHHCVPQNIKLVSAVPEHGDGVLDGPGLHGSFLREDLVDVLLQGGLQGGLIWGHTGSIASPLIGHTVLFSRT